MKNVINLLEKMGASAEFKQLDGKALEKVLNPLDLDTDLQAAILKHDNSALEMILDARNEIVCIICPAEEEPTQEPSEDEDEQEDKEQKALVSNGR